MLETSGRGCRGGGGRSMPSAVAPMLAELWAGGCDMGGGTWACN